MRGSGRKKNPETIVLECVRDWLRWKGWMVIRNQQGLGSTPGMPDLLAIREGRHLWIEVKAPAHRTASGAMVPAGRLSDHQERYAGDLHRHGAEFLLVRSVEDLEAYLVPQATKIERMEVRA